MTPDAQTRYQREYTDILSVSCQNKEKPSPISQPSPDSLKNKRCMYVSMYAERLPVKESLDTHFRGLLERSVNNLHLGNLAI